jgi:hypothetical protein
MDIALLAKCSYAEFSKALKITPEADIRRFYAKISQALNRGEYETSVSSANHT